MGYGAVDPATLTAASGAVPAQAAPAPVGEGKDVLSPLEGKFFLVKNAQETPKKVGEKVNKGDVISIIGPSGSGKTTLLRCMNFLETADAGEMTFDGKTYEINRMHRHDILAIRKKTAFVFQN